MLLTEPLSDLQIYPTKGAGGPVEMRSEMGSGLVACGAIASAKNGHAAGCRFSAIVGKPEGC